ncbi:MAG: PIN domain-containing protein [Bacteroidota bacterium]
MSEYARPYAVLDANVIYPAPVRDLLLNLAACGLFQPIWSDKIHEEWIRNLLKNRPDLESTKLARSVELMNSAFPSATISGYKDIIEDLTLPDPDDRHVLAVAIKSKAQFILTFNKKDFPRSYVSEFNIVILSPDEFLKELNSSDPEAVEKAFNMHLTSLKNPPIKRESLIKILQRCNIKSADHIFSS